MKPNSGPSTPEFGNDDRQRPWWRVAAWQVFEAADSGWSLIIYTTYFGVFVEQVLHRSAVHYGVAATLGGLMIALLSPLLGAMADVSGRRQPYFRFFALSAVALTVLIGYTNSYVPALVCFVLAYVSVNGAFNFWTSTLPAVANEVNVPAVVSGAVGISYLSNIFVQVGMGQVASTGVQHVFLPMALIYLVYSLPNMTIAPDFAERSKKRLDVGGAYRRIAETFRDVRQHRELFLFLCADFAYENAAASIIALMVVYARHVGGFAVSDLPLLFGPALAIAGVAAFGFGKLIKRIGPKKVVLLDLCIWLALIILVVLFNQKPFYYFVAGPLTGIGLAGVWSSSRTLMTALTPVERSGEFWGLFNLSGRTAAVLGDLTWTAVLWIVGESVFGYKLAIGSLALFILAGMYLLRFVPDVRPSAGNVLH